MFLAGERGRGLLRDIPRIRGGVSEEEAIQDAQTEYSPHPRGCFRSPMGLLVYVFIFPASAGVFLEDPPVREVVEYIPRIRGGVSQV